MDRRAHKEILALAVPSVVSNITVPLLGLADSAIAGHMGQPVYIAALALGTAVFSMVYWMFAFLRMATTGLAAQARGTGDTARLRDTLRKSALTAVLASALLLALRGPLLDLALAFFSPGAAAGAELGKYYALCVWGAPAVLLQYSLTGWFIGTGDTRSPMAVAVAQNTLNIAASLLLVYGLGWRTEGLAAGTLAAEWAAAVMSALLAARRLRRLPADGAGAGRVPWARFFRASSDIFLRTLCLVGVTMWFARQGSRQGELTLAANALLMQLFTTYSYVTDGLANAGEALSGRCAGARDAEGLGRAVRALFAQGLCAAALFTLLYATAGAWLLPALTDQREVLSLARRYAAWAALVPLAAVTAFVWDGVFIGLTLTRGMLWSMALASAVFFAVSAAAQGPLGNHGLWLAFTLYLATRGAAQTALMWARRRDPLRGVAGDGTAGHT